MRLPRVAGMRPLNRRGTCLLNGRKPLAKRHRAAQSCAAGRTRRKRIILSLDYGLRHAQDSKEKIRRLSNAGREMLEVAEGFLEIPEKQRERDGKERKRREQSYHKLLLATRMIPRMLYFPVFCK